MFERRLSPDSLRTLLIVAAVWRLFVSVFTPVPGRDGANYLWMAERFAEGRFAAALGEVFPPGLPLALAPFVALFGAVGIPPFEAARIVQIAIGTFAIVPIVRLTQAHLGAGGFCAGCMMIAATRPVQLGAEVGSEPLFVLLVALALLDAAHGRYLRSGAWGGLSFWVRPEGMVVVLAVAAVRAVRGGWRALLGGAGAFVALGALRAVCGLAFWPEAKWALHEQRLFPGGAGLGERLAHYGGNLAELPVTWFEAFGLVGALALVGLLTRPHPDERRGRGVLYATLLGALAAIVTFLTRWRFLAAWIPVVAVFAVAGLRRVPARGQWPLLFFVILLGLLGGLNHAVSHQHRHAERVLANWLADDLEPGQQIVTDLTRVRYFAGLHPLEPRPYSADELLAQSRAPNARYLVFAIAKGGVPQPGPLERAVLAALGDDWKRVVLPEDVAPMAETRGLWVWRKGER